MSRGNKETRNASFFKSTFTALLTITVIITVILAVFLMGTYFKTSNSLVNRFFNNLLSQSNYSITYVNGLARELSNSLTYKKEVVEFLNMSKTDNWVTVKANQTVNSHTAPLSYVDGVYLYNKKQDLVLSTKYGTQSTLANFYDKTMSKLISEAEGRSAFGKAQAPIVHEVNYEGRNSTICSYAVPDFSFEGEITSVLVVNIDINVLTKSLENINSFNSYAKFLLMDGEGNVLGNSPFQSGESADMLMKTVKDSINSSQTGTKTVKIGGVRYLMSYSNVNSNNWYIFGMVPRSILYKDIAVSMLWCVVVILAVFALCSLLAFYLAKRLNSPIKMIGQILKGEKTNDEASSVLHTEEFKYMASVFSDMQETNKQFSQYKNEASRFLRQDFFVNLLSGNNAGSDEKTAQQLNAFGCSYIADSQLCLCVFKIDNYAKFISDNGRRERWALRYAVINIASELFSEHFQCEVVQYDSDKFAAVIDCSQQPEYKYFTPHLEEVLQDILKQVNHHLAFSLTAAYSTYFNGVSHIARMCENTRDLLPLKIRCGHGKILNPYMAEDVDFNDFAVSKQKEDALLQNVLAVKTEQAYTVLDGILKELFTYSHNEISSYLIHLAYRIFYAVKDEAPSAKEDVFTLFKKFLSALALCEIGEDFKHHFRLFLNGSCEIIQEDRQNPMRQNTNLIVQAVLETVESRYSQPDLCLAYIADELGMSANYIGLLFRRSQDKSVAKHILDLRLEKLAYYLRTTSWPITKILEAVGFEQEQKNYLYTLFQKHFGISVKQYRLQNKEN